MSRDTREWIVPITVSKCKNEVEALKSVLPGTEAHHRRCGGAREYFIAQFGVGIINDATQQAKIKTSQMKKIATTEALWQCTQNINITLRRE
jgi:hypothetical protein